MSKRKKIYLIRHGETDYNRRGIVQGSGVNPGLNDWGKAQSEAFFDAYQHIPFDKVYTSALRRTQESIQSFIDLGIPHESYAGLNEISWGCREGVTPNTSDSAYYRQIIEAWQSGLVDTPCEEGESPADVRRRQKPVIDTILSRPEERTILIAMHGRAIRILLTMLLDEPLTSMDRYEHSNLCLYRIDYSYADQSFTLKTANDITHLLSLDVPQSM